MQFSNSLETTNENNNREITKFLQHGIEYLSTIRHIYFITSLKKKKERKTRILSTKKTARSFVILQFYDESDSFLDNHKFQQNLLLLRIEQNIFQVTLLNDIKISNGYEEMMIC